MELEQQRILSVVNNSLRSVLQTTDDTPLSSSFSQQEISKTRKTNADSNRNNYSQTNQNFKQRCSLGGAQHNHKQKDDSAVKEKALLEILQSKEIDLTREEDGNIAVYVLKKIIRTRQENEFLKLIITQGISLFRDSLEIAENCSQQILMRISHSFFKKKEIIFHYGDPGEHFYLILKGGVYCLVPNNRITTQHDNQIPNEREGDKFNLQSTDLDVNSRLVNQDQTQEQVFEQNDKEEHKRQIIALYPDFYIVKELQSGTSFGEIAVLTGEQRTATMICSEDTDLLKLSKKDFDKIIGFQKELIIQNTVEFLKKFSFLSQMTPSKLLSLWQFMKQETYSAGNIIYSEKDPCTHIYFIKEGDIEISRESTFVQQSNTLTQNRLGGNQRMVSQMRNKERVRLFLQGPYSYFGVMEMLHQLEYRENQAQCLSRAVIFSIEKKVTPITKDEFLFFIFQQKFLTFLKVFNYFKIFKREAKAKIEWEQQRNQTILSNLQINELLVNQSSSPIHSDSVIHQTENEIQSPNNKIKHQSQASGFHFSNTLINQNNFSSVLAVAGGGNPLVKNLVHDRKSIELNMSFPSIHCSVASNNSPRESIPSQFHEEGKNPVIDNIIKSIDLKIPDLKITNSEEPSNSLVNTSHSLQSKFLMKFQKQYQKQHNQVQPQLQLSMSASISKFEHPSHQKQQQLEQTQQEKQQQSLQQIIQKASKNQKSPSQKKKLPKLESNFIQFKGYQSSLSHLLNRQNRPIVDILESLKKQGLDITTLSKLSQKELKELSRKLQNEQIQRMFKQQTKKQNEESNGFQPNESNQKFFISTEYPQCLSSMNIHSKKTHFMNNSSLMSVRQIKLNDSPRKQQLLEGASFNSRNISPTIAAFNKSHDQQFFSSSRKYNNSIPSSTKNNISLEINSKQNENSNISQMDFLKIRYSMNATRDTSNSITSRQIKNQQMSKSNSIKFLHHEVSAPATDSNTSALHKSFNQNNLNIFKQNSSPNSKFFSSRQRENVGAVSIQSIEASQIFKKKIEKQKETPRSSLKPQDGIMSSLYNKILDTQQQQQQQQQSCGTRENEHHKNQSFQFFVRPQLKDSPSSLNLILSSSQRKIHHQLIKGSTINMADKSLDLYKFEEDYLLKKCSFQNIPQPNSKTALSLTSITSQDNNPIPNKNSERIHVPLSYSDSHKRFDSKDRGGIHRYSIRQKQLQNFSSDPMRKKKSTLNNPFSETVSQIFSKNQVYKI